MNKKLEALKEYAGRNKGFVFLVIIVLNIYFAIAVLLVAKEKGWIP